MPLATPTGFADAGSIEIAVRAEQPALSIRAAVINAGAQVDRRHHNGRRVGAVAYKEQHKKTRHHRMSLLRRDVES